jgi:hypothetical protein
MYQKHYILTIAFLFFLRLFTIIKMCSLNKISLFLYVSRDLKFDIGFALVYKRLFDFKDACRGVPWWTCILMAVDQ